MAFRPYFQWNGTIYTAQQALTFLNNQYPNARYTQIMERIGRTIHWGFNYTNLPPAIQNNLQAIYFKLEDYNFPLSNIELRENEVDGKNYTEILIPKANLAFDFADIISQDFNVKVNQTGVAIYNVTGKADLYLDPITYSAPTITVIGYTSGTPCNFLDIYNADVAGGWGVVTKDSSTVATQYEIDALLVFGNSSALTYFKDTLRQVTFNAYRVSNNSITLISVTVNATFTLGSLLNEATYSSHAGCDFKVLGANGKTYTFSIAGTGYFYSSSFSAELCTSKTATSLCWLISGVNCRFWNCRLNQLFFSGLNSSSLYNVQNYYSNPTNKGFIDGYVSGNTFDTVRVLNSYAAVSGTFSVNRTVENLFCRNLTYTVLENNGGSNCWLNLVNPDVDTFSFYWMVNDTDIGVNRQYTIDLTVQDSTGAAIENATLSLLDNTGTEVFTDTLTNSTGLMDTQTVTMGYYGTATGNTLNNYGPFLLNVTKTGYQSYVQNFTLTEKTDWTITLSESTATTEETNNAALIWSLLFGALAFALFLAWWVRN